MNKKSHYKSGFNFLKNYLFLLFCNLASLAFPCSGVISPLAIACLTFAAASLFDALAVLEQHDCFFTDLESQEAFLAFESQEAFTALELHDAFCAFAFVAFCFTTSFRR